MATKTKKAKKPMVSPKEISEQRAKNAEANKNAQEQKKAPKKPKQIVYLPEGMTGKDLMKNRSASNKAHKDDMGSFSYCLKRALKFDAGFIASMKVDVDNLTPRRLLRFQSEGEKKRHAKQKANNGKVRYSVWEVQGLIQRYVKSIHNVD